VVQRYLIHRGKRASVYGYVAQGQDLGLELMVETLGSRVGGSGVWCRLLPVSAQVSLAFEEGLRLRVSSLGFRVEGLGFQI